MVLAINRAKAQFNNLHLSVFKNDSVVVVTPMHNDYSLRQHRVKMGRCLCRTGNECCSFIRELLKPHVVLNFLITGSLPTYVALFIRSA